VPIPHSIKGEAIYAYVALRGEVDWTEELRAELRDWVRKNIGALASPERIQFVEHMPKTLSGKIVRRLLRKIASGEKLENLGDTSTIARPEVLEDIQRAWLRLEAGQGEK
ncbi:MAG: acetyl-coenzyme A synthetase, partial [Desulfovibrio sp.]|nr:acetyl-coenzyme A synthetase [Desulfovibrio sp.]